MDKRRTLEDKKRTGVETRKIRGRRGEEKKRMERKRAGQVE